MKTIRIALPFVSEIRPLLDEGLTYAQVGEFDFTNLHLLVQDYICKNVELDVYHEAVCRKFTEMLERDFRALIPSAKLEYVGFDEYDVYVDFTHEEQELAKVCREHETALEELLTNLDGPKQDMTWKDWTTDWTELDEHTQILQYLLESKPNYKAIEYTFTLRLLVPLQNYVDLHKFAKLAEETNGLVTEALLEFMEYKRQTNFTEDRYDRIRAGQLAIVEGQIKDMIYNYEETR